MKIGKIKAVVVAREQLTSDVYSMWLSVGDMAKEAKAGQFIALYTADDSRLLPRPISICEIDQKHGQLRIVYRVVGYGTEEFSKCQIGDRLDVMGPLGNGYPLERTKDDGNGTKEGALLVAGGIGIPPLLELAKKLDGKKTIVLGYKDELFLNKEFEAYGRVILATENGSYGIKGNVLDAIRAKNVKADVVYSCGPIPMLRAVKAYAEEQGVEAWVSMEEKMACGIGACLACVCQSKEVDPHTHVHNKRICKEGPVFNAQEVVL